MARPPKELKWDNVLKRMQAGNPAKQIAFDLEIDLTNFYEKFKKEFGCGFADYADPARELGRSNIAYVQYAKAMSGNVQMLTLLGREWNGQGADIMPMKAANQPDIDKDHIIMRLENRIAILEANANEPKAE